MGLNVEEVSAQSRARFGPQISSLERGITYAYGDDRFEIDHGPDYFRFFDRLGETSTFVVVDGSSVVASATGVLRKLRRADGNAATAWYCCDLKVARSHRGRRLPLRILLAGLRSHYRTCRRGYGVAMRPNNGRRAPVIRLMEHIRVIGSSVGPALEIFELDADRMAVAEPILAAHRGSVGYLSLAGRKDLILESSATPIPLLHAQFGTCAQPEVARPQQGSRHMFCSPSGDRLTRDLRAAGIESAAIADIVHHGMARWDWSFVLTSDL